MPPRKRAEPPTFESVLAETDRAIAAATHLGPMDAGSVAVIRELAQTIDNMHDRPATDLDGKALPLDNVTIPTYLRFAEALGLTPAGRTKLAEQKPKPTGKLGQLRAVRGGASDGDQHPPQRTSRRSART